MFVNKALKKIALLKISYSELNEQEIGIFCLFTGFDNVEKWKAH